MAETEQAKYACPGQFMFWSAFGANYSDTVCAETLNYTFSETGERVGPYLQDLDSEYVHRDVPCPFCDPEGFDRWTGHPGDAAAVRKIEVGEDSERRINN